MQSTEEKRKISTAERIVDIFSGVIDWIFIIFFLIVLLFAAYAIYDSMKVYDEAKLPKIVLDHVEITEDGGRKIDFDALKAQNSDLSAWIVLDDTNIDYVVMHTSNNDYYLWHGFDNGYANTGSLFVDYRNSKNWTDDYNLIYGHNMNGDIMFGQLNRFHDKEFFSTHHTGKLYTPDGNYKLEVIAEMATTLNDKDVYDVTSIKNDLAKTKEIIKSGANQLNEDVLNSANKIIALTTCKDTSGNRQIVYLKATKE